MNTPIDCDVRICAHVASRLGFTDVSINDMHEITSKKALDYVFDNATEARQFSDNIINDNKPQPTINVNCATNVNTHYNAIVAIVLINLLWHL